MQKIRSKRQALKSVRNLISLADYAEFVGSAMTKWGIRSTVAAGALAMCMYALHEVGGMFDVSWGLPFSEAAKLPRATGLVVLIPGVFLKYGSRIFSTTNITLAEAAGFNLIKDYRKGEINTQITVLWERLFKWEARLTYPIEEIEEEAERLPRIKKEIQELLRRHLTDEHLDYLGVNRTDDGLPDLVDALCAVKPFSPDIEKSKEAFADSARWAFEHPQDLEKQQHETGFDLRQVEDFRDAAYFHKSDVKLTQQYFGNAWIIAAKKAIGSYAWHDLRLQPALASQKFWFKFITRTLSGRLGSAVKELRQTCGRQISIHHLLWPGVENDITMTQESREAIVEKRIEILRGIFGQTLAEADIMLERMVLPVTHAITELRMRFDPEYCDGSLGYTLEKDLAAFRCRAGAADDYKAFADKARRQQAELMEYIRNRRSYLLSFANTPDLRTIRIAFHINSNGFKKSFERGDITSGEFQAFVRNAVSQRDDFQQMLYAIRMEHTIAVMQWIGYQTLLKQLAYPETEGLPGVRKDDTTFGDEQ